MERCDVVNRESDIQSRNSGKIRSLPAAPAGPFRCMSKYLAIDNLMVRVRSGLVH